MHNSKTANSLKSLSGEKTEKTHLTLFWRDAERKKKIGDLTAEQKKSHSAVWEAELQFRLESTQLKSFHFQLRYDLK